MLQSLAQTFAKLKGAEILASRIDGDTIVIILDGLQGGKFVMTEPQLQEAIQKSQPSKPFEYIEEAVKKETKKSKSTKGASK